MTQTSPSNAPRVLVAVATYKRVDLLDILLESLTKLTFEKTPKIELAIAVIDNDPAMSAESVFEERAKHSPWRMTYHTEEKPGVTFVRNQALALADGSDFLAFIDDDEFATPQWLDELMARQQETKAAAVFGPVHPVYNEDAAAWVRNWGVHGKYIDADEEQTKPGATSNCLIDMHVLRKEALTFDPKMSLTGAEDTLFFSILLDRGYKFHRASKALVHEHIPNNRAEADWILKRWYRTGVTDSIVAGRNSSEPLNRAKALVGGVIRLGLGGAAAAATTIIRLGWKNPLVMKRLYTVCRGAGMVSYAVGGSYEEYSRKKIG